MSGSFPAQCRVLARHSRTAATIDASSGLLWQDGCAGPKVTRGFFNLNDMMRAIQLAAGRRGMGRPSGERPRAWPAATRTRTSYFYTNSFAPSGRTWGAPFMPRARCPIYVAPQPVCDPFAVPPHANACDNLRAPAIPATRGPSRRRNHPKPRRSRSSW